MVHFGVSRAHNETKTVIKSHLHFLQSIVNVTLLRFWSRCVHAISKKVHNPFFFTKIFMFPKFYLGFNYISCLKIIMRLQKGFDSILAGFTYDAVIINAE